MSRRRRYNDDDDDDYTSRRRRRNILPEMKEPQRDPHADNQIYPVAPSVGDINYPVVLAGEQNFQKSRRNNKFTRFFNKLRKGVKNGYNSFYKHWQTGKMYAPIIKEIARDVETLVDIVNPTMGENLKRKRASIEKGMDTADKILDGVNPIVQDLQEGNNFSAALRYRGFMDDTRELLKTRYAFANEDSGDMEVVNAGPMDMTNRNLAERKNSAESKIQSSNSITIANAIPTPVKKHKSDASTSNRDTKHNNNNKNKKIQNAEELKNIVGSQSSTVRNSAIKIDEAIPESEEKSAEDKDYEEAMLFM